MGHRASMALPWHRQARRYGIRFQSLALHRHDALQQLWRDFRIATCSRDRNDAPLPKIWTPASLRAHETRTMEASMNQLAAVGKLSHVKPGDHHYWGAGLRVFFRDHGIAAAPITPWK